MKNEHISTHSNHHLKFKGTFKLKSYYFASHKYIIPPSANIPLENTAKSPLIWHKSIQFFETLFVLKTLHTNTKGIPRNSFWKKVEWWINENFKSILIFVLTYVCVHFWIIGSNQDRSHFFCWKITDPHPRFLMSNIAVK